MVRYIIRSFINKFLESYSIFVLRKTGFKSAKYSTFNTVRIGTARHIIVLFLCQIIVWHYFSTLLKRGIKSTKSQSRQSNTILLTSQVIPKRECTSLEKEIRRPKRNLVVRCLKMEEASSLCVHFTYTAV
jgi:hypothetical protein